MRHHRRSPFGRISKAVSAALIGLALGMVATPFAAADPIGSPTPTASSAASDAASPSPTASPDPTVTPTASESPSPSVVTTTPAITTSPTPEASVTSSPSERRSPNPEVVNAPPDVTGVSGFLRDATTGAPIHNGCVAWRPASATSTATNGTTGIGDKGKWSINTGDPGPFYIAFYVTDDREDCSQSALTGPDNYRASWYRGHPFFGTDPLTAVPPRDADPVAAGSTVVACLGRNNTLPTTCTVPDRTASGRVVRAGNVPIRNACIVALGPDNLLANVAVSSADGRWKLTGLPINYDYIVGAIPSFQTRAGPCGESDEGPPPAPPPGALQPEFYDDTWADLAELGGRDDAFAWATDPNSPHPRRHTAQQPDRDRFLSHHRDRQRDRAQLVRSDPDPDSDRV
jgi:hypothetical protein